MHRGHGLELPSGRIDTHGQLFQFPLGFGSEEVGRVPCEYLLKYLVPFSNTVGPHQAVKKPVLMAIGIVAQRCRESENRRLNDQFTNAHQVEKCRRIGVLERKVESIPHSLQREGSLGGVLSPK